jgi:transposase
MSKKNYPKKRAVRSFTEEFKRDAVEGYTYKNAADAVGVCSRTIRDWYDKFAVPPEACGDDATVGELQAELKRLRKELKQAELEREILKKATAYFAKESQ